jgi:hypothetical protein
MKDVLVLVNQPDFQQLMDIYLDEKKKEYYRILEQSDDEKELYRAQGACTLLNKMKNMKVEVQTKAKRG